MDTENLEMGDGKASKEILRLTLVELFAGKTPSEWRAAYAGTFEWGPDEERKPSQPRLASAAWAVIARSRATKQSRRDVLRHEIASLRSQ